MGLASEMHTFRKHLNRSLSLYGVRLIIVRMIHLTKGQGERDLGISFMKSE